MAPRQPNTGSLRTRRVRWHDHDGQVVILGPRAQPVALNPAAGLLWRRLSEGCNRRALVTTLLTAYDVDEPTAELDVDRFLDRLASKGLLAGAL